MFRFLRWLAPWTTGGYKQTKGSNPAEWDVDLDSGRTLAIASQREALAYSAIWQVVSMIAFDAASMPLVVTDRRMEPNNPDSVRRNQPSYWLVRRTPRPNYNAQRWWQRVFVQYLLWNNSYAFIGRDGLGTPRELRELETQWVEYDKIDDFYRIVSGPFVSGSMQFGAVSHEDMLHFEGVALGDEQDRLDLWRMASQSWGLGLTVERFLNAFFDQGAKPSGMLVVPRAMKKETREKVADDFAKKWHNKSNWFRSIVLRDGTKFESTQVTPKDAELNELREHQVAEVARWFRVPPSKLGLAVNTSYGSLIEEQRAYYEQTLGPMLRMVQNECWQKLLPERTKRDEDTFFVHDLAPLFGNDPDMLAEAQRQPRPSEQTQPTPPAAETDETEETEEETNGRHHQRLRGSLL